jgi:hypothetical protein
MLLWLGLAGLKLDSFIDIAVSCWVLRADAVVCLLCVGRVQNKPRPVHQVVKVAVVRTVVQNWEGLWPGIGLKQSSEIGLNFGYRSRKRRWFWRRPKLTVNLTLGVGDLCGCTIKDDRTHFFPKIRPFEIVKQINWWLAVLWKCHLIEWSV